MNNRWLAGLLVEWLDVRMGRKMGKNLENMESIENKITG